MPDKGASFRIKISCYHVLKLDKCGNRRTKTKLSIVLRHCNNLTLSKGTHMAGIQCTCTT